MYVWIYIGGTDSLKSNKNDNIMTKEIVKKCARVDALFTFVKGEKLHGIVISHVDDLLMAGDEIFEDEHLPRTSRSI